MGSAHDKKSCDRSATPIEKGKIVKGVTVQRQVLSRQVSRTTRNTVTQRSEEAIHLPEFGSKQNYETIINSKKRLAQTQNVDSLGSQVIGNSHVPLKALDYLQLVDEPGVQKIVSQFSSHQYQAQFNKPLPQKTLFLNHVQSINRE